VNASDRFVALGVDANRDVVLDGGLAGYRFVHFATHGVLDSRNPQQSSIELSQFDANGAAREGSLRLHDIRGLRFDAELAVLSGCDTALGERISGEGLVGLTRGFLYAGVPAVVASLWQVSDRSTAELMVEMYHSLLVDGLRPAAALRRAQLAVYESRTWRDPYYWGAFVLQGDWR
jgi:CHAT domain-containing protein